MKKVWLNRWWLLRALVATLIMLPIAVMMWVLDTVSEKCINLSDAMNDAADETGLVRTLDRWVGKPVHPEDDDD